MTVKIIKADDLKTGLVVFAQQGENARVAFRITEMVMPTFGKVQTPDGRNTTKAFIGNTYMVSDDATEEDFTRHGDYGQSVYADGSDVRWISHDFC